MAAKQRDAERQFILEVLDIYKSLPVLWKIKSNDYSNRMKKDLAYEQLLEKYREKNPNATVDDLNGTSANGSARVISTSTSSISAVY